MNRAPPRGRPERAELRRSALVRCPVKTRRVGPHLADFCMIRPDNLARLCVGVAGLFRRHDAVELAVESAEDNAWIPHGLQRVPGHHHLGGCIRAELRMQAGDRRWGQLIGRWGCSGCGQSGVGSDQGRRDRGPSRDTRSGQQLATAELEIECGVLCGHGLEVAPQ